MWVVYFSLAALPLFGIGQWFIPESDVAGRRHAFWLLFVYVASGMGLLLTTSFLGLRRYLRQRRIEMPTADGQSLAGHRRRGDRESLLVVAALLPRPSAEYAISRLPFTVGSPEQNRSKVASVPREGVQDEEPGYGPRARTAAGQRAGRSERSRIAAAGRRRGRGRTAAKNRPPRARPNNPTRKVPLHRKTTGRASRRADRASSRRSKKVAVRTTRDKKKLESKSQSKDNDQKSPSQAAEDSSTKQDEPNTKLAKAEEKQPAQSKDAAEKQEHSTESQSHPAAEQMKAAAAAAATISSFIFSLIQWAVYVVVALAALYACWRFRAEILAAWRSFLQELRNFWNRLFGVQRPRGVSARDAEQLEIPPAPFSSYADPFATGIAGRYSMTELVRYTFEAFEAWSREHGCPRHADQTPHELARDVSKLNAHIAVDARNLAELYSRAAYARGELSPGDRGSSAGPMAKDAAKHGDIHARRLPHWRARLTDRPSGSKNSGVLLRRARARLEQYHGEAVLAIALCYCPACLDRRALACVSGGHPRPTISRISPRLAARCNSNCVASSRTCVPRRSRSSVSFRLPTLCGSSTAGCTTPTRRCARRPTRRCSSKVTSRKFATRCS